MKVVILVCSSLYESLLKNRATRQTWVSGWDIKTGPKSKFQVFTSRRREEREHDSESAGQEGVTQDMVRVAG